MGSFFKKILMAIWYVLAGACILALYATPAYVYFGGAYYASKNGSFHCIAALAIPPYAVYKTGEHHYRNFFPPELDLYEEKRLLLALVNHEFEAVDIPEPDRLVLVSRLRAKLSNIEQKQKSQLYSLIISYSDAMSDIHLCPFNSFYDGTISIKDSYLNTITDLSKSFTDEAATDQFNEMLASYESMSNDLLNLAIGLEEPMGVPKEELNEARAFVVQAAFARKSKALQVVRTILD